MAVKTKTKPAIGLAPARQLTKVRVGAPTAAGCNADVSDLVLHSEASEGLKLAVELGASIIGAELERTIEGASTVTIQVYDPEMKILTAAMMRQRFLCKIANLWFKLVSVSKQGFNVTLVFEDREVSWLRELTGPKKAYRDMVTRAEFFLMLLQDVKKGTIEFYCPEIHKKQPIKQEKELTQTSSNPEDNEKQSNRGTGISSSEASKLTVKGEPIKPQNLQNLNTVLDVGMSLSPQMPYKVLWAAVAAGTVESLFKNYKAGEAEDGTDSHGIFQQRPSSGFTSSDDVAVQAKQFYLGTDNGIKGAYEIWKENEDVSAGDLAADYENPAEQYRGRYSEWAGEAKRNLDAYLGGAGIEEGSVSVESTQRYAFQIGKKQDYWDWMGEAAEEVQWRRFMVAGKLYYCSEGTLFQSEPRMYVSPTARGIENVDYDYTMGKKHIEATITCWGKDWAAPPGTTVHLDGYGPVDGIQKGKEKEKYAGRYLVIKINNNLFTNYVSITVRKPMKPLPEPAPQTSTKTYNIEGSGGGKEDLSGAPQKVAEIIEAVDKFDEASPGYSEAYHAPNGTFAPLGTKTDCSGFVSSVCHAAGYLTTPLTSGEFANVFPHGNGEWMCIYGDGEHVVAKVKYPDGHWRGFATSHENPGGGPGWISDDYLQMEEGLRGNVCHPPGL